ncbi:hypothetical protein BDY21DRAFT_334825 [Lineolata rhizophorae]|uniref:Uncharacterized protein n=1 Tax=Lineolata rhizophorae TaxID=578093 RepID=A0A6A6P9Y6_9PEZI|nr:hypothetical protein BDY21DRAFT_334825 [Lineolata rhizophorae]
MLASLSRQASRHNPSRSLLACRPFVRSSRLHFGDPANSGCTALRNGGASRSLHSAEMNEADLASLRVDNKRLMRTLHYTCQWGMGKRWGK